MDSQIVAKFKKSLISEIRVTIGNYKGKTRIDVREYFRLDSNPEFLPSKKGVSLPAERIDELISIVKCLTTEDGIKEYGSLELGNKNKIVVAQREFSNHIYNELRVFYFDSELQKWLPSNKGITFKTELTIPLIEALENCSVLQRN